MQMKRPLPPETERCVHTAAAVAGEAILVQCCGWLAAIYLRDDCNRLKFLYRSRKFCSTATDCRSIGNLFFLLKDCFQIGFCSES